MMDEGCYSEFWKEINISHLGKRKIIFKIWTLKGGYVSSLEGIFFLIRLSIVIFKY